MAKFYGTLGYRDTREVRNGIWLPTFTERQYVGDIIRRTSRAQQSAESENDEITLSNEFSIIADPYAYDNFANLQYVVWMGTKWRVTKTEVRPPRLILTIGGVYNDPSENEQ